MTFSLHTNPIQVHRVGAAAKQILSKNLHFSALIFKTFLHTAGAVFQDDKNHCIVFRITPSCVTGVTGRHVSTFGAFFL